MNDLVMNHSGVLTLSDSDRIRIAAAWEALSVNSRRSYQGVCPPRLLCGETSRD